MSPIRPIEDPPPVDPAARRIVFATAWICLVVTVVAWRTTDGLPLADGLFAGAGLAALPLLLRWLRDEDPDMFGGGR